MKRLLNTYLPSLAITFTATAAAICIVNLTQGFSSVSCTLLLEILGFILLTEAADFLLGKIPFPNCAVYILCEFVVFYGLFLVFGFFPGGWFGAGLSALLQSTVIFIILFGLLQLYFYHTARENARKINSRLK